VEVTVAISLVVNITEAQCNVHGKMIPIRPGQVLVKVDRIRVQGAVLVMLDDKVRDQAVRVNSISIEMDDLRA
jgi:hypothetical protein